MSFHVGRLCSNRGSPAHRETCVGAASRPLAETPYLWNCCHSCLILPRDCHPMEGLFMGSQCHKIRIICQAFFNLNARFVRWSAVYGLPSFSAPITSEAHSSIIGRAAKLVVCRHRNGHTILCPDHPGLKQLLVRLISQQ